MGVSGILNLDKPPGWTSFQVVSLVRRGSGARKVGHAGTLDPQATGVLLVCLGQAVRVSEYLMELSKVYRAVIHLGLATDTYDAEGRPVFEGDVSNLDVEAVRVVLDDLQGEGEQTPPQFSAVKVGGRPAYQLARAGKTVALRPRSVRIDRIELLGFQLPTVEIEVECGKGTYIRSLAHELGQRLGCGAHLRSLVRLRAGPFSLDKAIPLGELKTALADGSWTGRLLPMDTALEHLPAATLDRKSESDVCQGQPLPAELPELAGLPRGPAQRCRAYGGDGLFLALLRYESRTSLWRPEKVFASRP